MRWPWNVTPERDEDQTMIQEETQKITAPAREEIRISQERLSRIDRIIKEARAAELAVKKANQR